ncbi:MAG: hypothetical protein NDJ18_03055, partial [candidate division Zixibacteria bacterium]|nr:hypothetical protein [candidate division Zixibacteria bacterium]
MEVTFIDHFALWVAAFLTLGIISFLYKDNVWYKICESIFIGISAGYWFVMLFWDNLHGKFFLGVFPREGTQRADDWYMLFVGATLGVMMLMRLLPKVGWISRWPLAFIVGATAGINLIIYFASNVMVQVEDTVRPLFGNNYGATLYDIFGNIVVAVGTFTGLIYFFFSKEHKGAFGGAAKIGIF